MKLNKNLDNGLLPHIRQVVESVTPQQALQATVPGTPNSIATYKPFTNTINRRSDTFLTADGKIWVYCGLKVVPSALKETPVLVDVLTTYLDNSVSIMEDKPNKPLLKKFNIKTYDDYAEFYTKTLPELKTMNDITLRDILISLLFKPEITMELPTNLHELTNGSYYLDKRIISSVFNSNPYYKWWVATVGKLNDIRLNHMYSPACSKEMSYITKIEGINTDVNKLQIPKLYPISYYRKFYKYRQHKEFLVDNNNKLPIFIFEQNHKKNRFFMTTDPVAFIIRQELIRVNPFLETMLPRLCVTGIENPTYGDLETIIISTLTTDPSKLYAVEGCILDAMIKNIKNGNTLTKDDYSVLKQLFSNFTMMWSRTIKNVPRKFNNLKDMYDSTVVEIMGMIEHGLRVPSVRSTYFKNLSYKCSHLQSVLNTLHYTNGITTAKYNRITTDLKIIEERLDIYIKHHKQTSAKAKNNIKEIAVY